MNDLQFLEDIAVQYGTNVSLEYHRTRRKWLASVFVWHCEGNSLDEAVTGLANFIEGKVDYRKPIEAGPFKFGVTHYGWADKTSGVVIHRAQNQLGWYVFRGNEDILSGSSLKIFEDPQLAADAAVVTFGQLAT